MTKLKYFKYTLDRRICMLMQAAHSWSNIPNSGVNSLLIDFNIEGYSIIFMGFDQIMNERNAVTDVKKKKLNFENYAEFKKIIVNTLVIIYSMYNYYREI